MIADSILYRDLAYVFAAALLGGIVARKLRQPLILGYVLGGILIGPFTPGPTVSEVRALELFAEIGVILLMYSIGMEFSITDLLQVKWVSLIGGPLGIVAVIALSWATGCWYRTDSNRRVFLCARQSRTRCRARRRRCVWRHAGCFTIYDPVECHFDATRARPDEAEGQRGCR